MPRLVALVAWLGLLAGIAGCGGDPPSPVAAGPSGIVRVAVDRTGAVEGFFTGQDRARLIVPGGAVVADWPLGDIPTDTSVPAGDYILQAFTAFMSDTVVCMTDPQTGKATNCVQPTLKPGQICEILITVPPGGVVEATFTVVGQFNCRLVPGVAPPIPSPTTQPSA